MTTWLTLDRATQHYLEFAAQVIDSVRAVLPGFGSWPLALLDLAHPPSSDYLAWLIANACEELPEELILVLDELEVVTDPSCLEFLGALLTRLPTLVHLVVCSRSEPDLPLADLRARNELVEIRGADLLLHPFGSTGVYRVN